MFSSKVSIPKVFLHLLPVASQPGLAGKFHCPIHSIKDELANNNNFIEEQKKAQLYDWACVWKILNIVKKNLSWTFGAGKGLSQKREQNESKSQKNRQFAVR